MPPHATKSSTSSRSNKTAIRHWSASMIAKDIGAFKQVQKANNFAAMMEPTEEETLISIHDSVKLPSKAIKDDTEFLAWSFSRYSINPALDGGVSWSSDDPYDLGHLKYAFAVLWNEHLHASKENELESDLRAGIDTLMRQAFDGKYRKDRNLSRAKYQSYVSQQYLRQSEGGCGLHDASNVFSVKEYKDHILLAAFVFEAKLTGDEDVGKGKICFDLCSAQHQRRAVGFSNHHIYGALLVGSTYTLYSSQWMKEGILIYPTTTVFDLSRFSEFLKLFVFLCRLADSIANEVDEMDREFNRDRDKFERRLKNATQNPWRPRRYPSGSVSGAGWQQNGSAEDGRNGSLSEGMSDDSDDEGNGTSHDAQELPRLPLKKCHVKGIQKSTMDIHSWANQSTEESSVKP